MFRLFPFRATGHRGSETAPRADTKADPQAAQCPYHSRLSLWCPPTYSCFSGRSGCAHRPQPIPPPAAGRDAHAPGLWMHIEPGEFWLAAGVWKPDAEALGKVRQAIAERPQAWLTARDDRRFRRLWEVVADSLKRPPRGFDPDHPLIDDLKRKESLGFRDRGVEQLLGRGVVKRVADCHAASAPFLRFLCRALDLPF